MSGLEVKETLTEASSEQVGSTIVRVVAGVRSQNVVTAFPPGSHCA